MTVLLLEKVKIILEYTFFLPTRRSLTNDGCAVVIRELVFMAHWIWLDPNT